jgi:hypothetical protein
MSSNTWTADALGSSAIALKGRCWRVVEAQSLVSTTKITDTVEEQETLERLIEETKDEIPEECRHLGFLLYTPFRYRPYPYNSRFRRAGSPDGVFYAAEICETAIAEKTFYRLLFYLESPDTPWPTNPGEYTAFASEYAVAKAADLTIEPLVGQRALWTHCTDYTACLNFADAARAAALDAIRYRSVRDPRAQANIALLTCRAFVSPDLVDRRTWHLYFSKGGVRAFCEFPRSSLTFDRTVFDADPRMASMRWDR